MYERAGWMRVARKICIEKEVEEVAVMMRGDVMLRGRKVESNSEPLVWNMAV